MAKIFCYILVSLCWCAAFAQTTHERTQIVVDNQCRQKGLSKAIGHEIILLSAEEDLPVQTYEAAPAPGVLFESFMQLAQNDPCISSVSELETAYHPPLTAQKSANDFSNPNSLSLKDFVAADPKFSEQTALQYSHLLESDAIFYDAKTGIQESILIGLVDQGPLNPEHPELKGILHPQSVVMGTRSRDYHAEMVTGVLAAKSFNGVGIRGVMGSNAQVLLLNASDSAEISNRIRTLGRNGAAVINVSLGVLQQCRRTIVGRPNGYKCQFPAIGNAAIAASVRAVMKENNTVVVVSAGNDSDFIPSFGDITKEGLIVVGSMNSHERIATYSNFGPGVSLLAPDFGVWGLTFNGYREEAATSFTTPLVAGAAALAVAYLRSNKIPYTPADIRRLILGSVRQVKSLTDSSEAGGYLDFGQLAQAAQTKVLAKKTLKPYQ